MFFFRAITNVSMASDDIFDQRKWPNCTLFAISLAVSKACDDHGVEITSADVRKLLVVYDDIFNKMDIGHFPDDFDGKNLKFYNRNPNADEYLSYTIRVDNLAVKRYKHGLNATRYVLVVWKYLDGNEDHCMYVIAQSEENGVRCFKCHNSMRQGGREPLIEVSREGNNLHRVTVLVNKRISL